MPLLKRKPVLLTPLPSLSAVLQPIAGTSSTANAEASTSSPHPEVAISPKASKSKNKDAPVPNDDPPNSVQLPADGKDDEDQMDKLLSAVRGEMPNTSLVVAPVKGKKARQSINTNGAGKHVNGDGGEVGENGHASQPIWKVNDRECFFIEETGEIFTDYESYSARRAFYTQNLFQCEVSGKSSLSYFGALQSEQKEVRQLHSRFPRQLKKAVLSSVQFQVEGKLENLADKIFERFHNRFFDEEKVFVDVQGDKYLARIVRTFPPRSLAPTSSPLHPTTLPLHPYAADLSLPIEEVNEKDDPMKYFYNVRLIEEGAEEGIAADYASANGYSNGPDEDDGKGEKWQASTMEIQADSISRDRINFSRAMLKRFIRDCVVRDAAVYSPWLVKPSVALKYGLPTEMSPEVRDRIARFKERQMDKRKREREERLGITHEPEPPAEEKEKPMTKKQKKEEERKAKEEEKQREKERLEEEERKKKKTLKYPAEDLLVEWQEDRDEPAGRIQVRPALNTTLPFGDQFEKFLLNWSFLNVMGNPLKLSPFTLDDFEQSLYHNDPWTNPAPLMTEIHATLLNVLIADLAAGNEAVKPLSACGRQPENDTDYWEGKKGATTETLSPAATPLAESWKVKELSARDGRKGWESALIGCLWERATLETLPNYLDNILHMTFEDKPAPTRPTWSTGPSTSSSTAGLVPAKPEKRYSSLHHTHKLEIINFLIELVAQTAAIRDFLEESTAALTEVRKDQVETKREWRRIQADREALEPKPEVEKPKEGGIDGDGDVSMSMSTDVNVKEERAGSPSSMNGLANELATASNTERDELDDSLGGGSDSEVSENESERDLNQIAASRRRAMKERALEREAEENLRLQRAAKEREDARIKKLEGKHIASEKKRLQEEEQEVLTKLRLLEYDFRAHLYTLRSRPLGHDRFGNKVWWFDGYGSAPLGLVGVGAGVGDGSKAVWGTGRVYLQGVEEEEAEIYRGAAGVVAEEEVEATAVEERREKEEGGRLGAGQWGSYDSVEKLHEFIKWLNPRGVREHHLLKALKMWAPEMEAGIKRRRLAVGLDVPPETDEPRKRPSRKAAHDDEKEGYMNWRNRRAS